MKLIRAKLEQLGISSKSLNAKNFKLVSMIVNEIMNLKMKVSEDKVEDSEYLNTLYKANSLLENLQLKLSRQLMSEMEKLAEVRSSTTGALSTDTKYKYHYDYELRLCEILTEKCRRVSSLSNDVAVKLKALNADDLLKCPLYAQENLRNESNHCYAQVLSGLKPLPEILPQGSVLSNESSESFLEKEMHENQLLREQLSLLEEKISNREV
jgi:hypothetical protein